MNIPIIPAAPETYIGPERRIAPPISREEHESICRASDRRLNERFDKIYERFVDGTERMNRIEVSIAAQKKQTDDIAKLQYSLATHIQQIDKSMAASADNIDSKMDKQDALLKENTEVTQSIKDVLDTAKGAFRVLGWIGDGLKWILGFGAAALGFWVAFKDFRSH